MPTGLVLEPSHGAVLVGDPTTLTIRVAGVYDRAGASLDVQVLSNPDDLESWVTVATTATEAQGSRSGFSIDVRPVSTLADLARWPRGGVIRLRVIDDAKQALAYDAADPTATVLVLANAADLPGGWTYLTEKPIGSVEETIAYYAAINAPPTLDAFMTLHGFPEQETSALYYNVGDLGIGRDMHCRSTTTPAGGVACYVRNYGTFGGTQAEAFAAMDAPPLATVAMVYTPPITAANAVSFLVYGPDGTLANEAPLDTRGDNPSIPQNCLNCHGGRARYDVTTHAVIGARFLPFDPAAFSYGSGPNQSLAAQEEKLRRLNRLVAATTPTAGVREMIEGLFPLRNSPYDPAWVPPGWSGSRRDVTVYREVIAPYCRSCHASFEATPTDPVAFRSAADVRAQKDEIVRRLCGAGPLGMPAAEATSVHFFRSSARGVLLSWLGAAGACAPAIELAPTL